MCVNKTKTQLGFSQEPVDVGTHLCIVFSSDEERRETLLKFLLSGMTEGERSICFSENITEENIRDFFQQEGISYEEGKSEDRISLSETSKVYFEGGRFDPERMLTNLTNFYNSSREKGFPASRVIGEMLQKVEKVPGGERLLEYESRVSRLVQETPITAVCQYDAREFDGATILDILKVHPKMYVNGAVISNPFYIEPDIYLNDRTVDG